MEFRNPSVRDAEGLSVQNPVRLGLSLKQLWDSKSSSTGFKYQKEELALWHNT